MRVNDIRLEVSQKMNQISIGRKIPDRMDRPAHLIENDDSISLLAGFFQKRSFRPYAGAGDQRHIMSHLVLALAGKKGIFLRSADNEPGDDVDDLQINFSAICTALVAAPFRIWSPLTNRSIPRPSSRLMSWRMRPTRMSSCPLASSGMGK